jgi:hypothetical protein
MRAAIFALEARGVGRGRLVHRNAEQNHAHPKNAIDYLTKSNKGWLCQGKGGGLRVGVRHSATTPATF